MALSTFLRLPACTSRMFSQQFIKGLSQAQLSHHSVASVNKLSFNLTPKESPILNAVRTFRTSAVRMSDEKPHDHAKLWVIEKGVSAILIPLLPVAVMLPNKLLDSVVAIAITAHMFWGLEAIAVDYVRATIFGPVIPKIAIGLVYILCIATLGGLFYIISHDVGLGNTVRQIWAIKSGAEQKA